MDAYFYSILAIASAFGFAFAISTRGIFYGSMGTDNEMMSYAAAQSSKWRIPSDIHKYGAGKTRMKDMAIMLLAIMQRILNDKESDYPYTVVTGFAVSISTILIFLIGRNIFNPTIGFLLSLLYITSFWPWQVSLYGGHANIANLFFLLATLAGLLSHGDNYFPILAGVFMCCALFSSASSTKLILPFWITIFFALYRQLLIPGNYRYLISILNPGKIINTILIFTALTIIGYVVIRLFKKYVVKLIYDQKAHKFLNKLMSGRAKFSIEHYQAHVSRKINQLFKWAFWLGISAIILFGLIPLDVVLKIISGFSLCLLLFLFPNIKAGVIGWFDYFLLPQRKTHFSGYVDYFAKRGIKVQRNTRGAGLSWFPNLLWTFTPFHLLIFIGLFTFQVYKNLTVGNFGEESIILAIITIISILPIIWAEVTKAPQIPRSYSSYLITGLLLPGYVLSDSGCTNNTLIALGVIVAGSFAWNLWKFVDDIYPGRMPVRNFMRLIKKIGIEDIYTYKTAHNDFFMFAIPGIGKSEYLPDRNVPPPFKIHYIKKLDEVKDGWIAIPGICPLTIAPNGDVVSDDFTNDKLLNNLLKTREVDKIATAKFETYFTSTIWVNEDDVASYCALHLKDYGPESRYRGYAWLVHSSKLRFND